MLFSATMAGEVADFARAHLRSPVRVEVARSGTTAERAEQQVFLADQNEKLALLQALLERDQDSTLIFTRTKRRADKVAKQLDRAGHSVTRIHADRSQSQRRAALDGFKEGTYRVLVATDIAARGIDVAEIGHVINFDLPHVAEDYVHRIGRTARAAASGRASSFASPEERDLLNAIEALTRARIPRGDVPRESESFQAEVKRSAEARGAPPRHSTARRGRPAAPRRDTRQPARSGASSQGSSRESSDATPSGAPRLVGSWRPARRR
jgi:ATP-dependent RNA helicase RhlE